MMLQHEYYSSHPSQWMRTGIFALLIALCLLFVSSVAVWASTVTISDPQRVLNTSQVQSAGQNLNYPLSIYVTNNYNGTQTQFDDQVKSHITTTNTIVMAIDTGHKYLAIAGGTAVPLSNSQYQDAVNAFKSNYNNGDYTGATVAAIHSLEASQNNASENGTNTGNRAAPSASGGIFSSVFGTLCCVGLIILAILAALFFVMRRRGGFGGPGNRTRVVPPYGQQPYGQPPYGQPPYNQYGQNYPPGYGPGYPGYNQGMNPWAAGGLGAAAGGLAGYELGKEEGEEQAREQDNNGGNQGNDNGGFGGGAGGNFGGDNGDNGGFGGGAGGDFGGGDWGNGGNDFGGGGDAGGGAGGSF